MAASMTIAQRCLVVMMVPLFLCTSLHGQADSWKPADGPLLTKWAKDVDPARPLPEHPRPQLVRDAWLNLNGLWQFAVAKAGERPPIGKELGRRILVPFPIESALSGVMESADRLWYRRMFEAPTEWRGKRVLLHFGAVDWEATVYVNGKRMIVHRGGYDAFTIDVTSALKRTGPQELVVGVFDPSDAGDQPRGKQVRVPKGIWYTPTTGIWQTVWLEAVPRRYIAQLSVTPDLDGNAVEVHARSSDPSLVVRVTVSDEGRSVASASGKSLRPVRIPMERVRTWSPDDPFLYDLTVELLDGDEVIDAVRSYVGMRSVAMEKDSSGVQRILLNGAPIMQIAPLDQGFWPDGLYTAPTDEALRSDIEITKKLGFNATRKHVKVEPERWYYWADKLGLLVWQDMPSGNNATAEAKQQFETELRQLIAMHANHPSVIIWVVFNEGWGQYDTERLSAWVKRLDPTRLVIGASGWVDKGTGDINDIHHYPTPKVPAPDANRALVLGEFGGLGLAIEGHTWREENWGYLGMTDRERLTSRYEDYLKRVHAYVRDSGLVAAVYTQITDVEVECNGLLTSDRAMLKPDAERIAAVNRGDFSRMPPPPVLTTVLPTSEREGRHWSYTFEQPDERWAAPGFDASLWKKGIGGFGTAGTPGAVVRTTWDTTDIWMRQEFEVTDSVYAAPHFLIHHDEKVEVYLNGTLVLGLPRHTVEYELVPLTDEARKMIRQGRNLIAIHCRQTKGGQYIDVGIVEVRPGL